MAVRNQSQYKQSGFGFKDKMLKVEEQGRIFQNKMKVLKEECDDLQYQRQKKDREELVQKPFVCPLLREDHFGYEVKQFQQNGKAYNYVD